MMYYSNDLMVQFLSPHSLICTCVYVNMQYIIYKMLFHSTTLQYSGSQSFCTFFNFCFFLALWFLYVIICLWFESFMFVGKWILFVLYDIILFIFILKADEKYIFTTYKTIVICFHFLIFFSTFLFHGVYVCLVCDRK